MTYNDAKNGLADIGRTYPILGGLLKKKIKNEKGEETTVFAHWCGILSSCDGETLSNVCYEIAQAERLPVPKGVPNDLMVVYIKQEVARRVGDLHSKHEQRTKYHTPGNCTARLSVKLEDLHKRKKISKEQLTNRLGELVQWDKGKSGKPEWVPQLLKGEK